MVWNPILKILNQSVPSGTKTPYTHPLDQDLLQLNEEEMKAVSGQWHAFSGTAPGAEGEEGKKRRLERNRFVHGRVHALNQKTLSAMTETIQAHKPPHPDYRALADKVLQDIARNPVANVKNVQNFIDGGQIGFCFGRALLTHYLLLRAGVPQRDMAKIFALGNLMVEGTFWRFHVAVLVRDPKVGYLVVDPLQKQAVDYRKWIATVSNYGIKSPLSRVRFYVTDPRKFLPAFGQYDLARLQDPVLKKYFDELGRSLTPVFQPSWSGTTRSH